ncbi:MAG: RNA 2',3'-cyclic phosphodiesterase [Elusimicrobiota bacterium]
MRTFIASQPDKIFIDKITQFEKYLKVNRIIDKIKIASSQNIHLTYIFLGDIVDEKNINNIKSIFSNFNNLPKIRFSAKKLGFFPCLQNPRVIWADIDKSAFNALIDIYKTIKKTLTDIGIYSNEEFVPHITLGRVKKKIFEKEITCLKSFEFNQMDGIFENIALFSSVLTPSGPIYNKLFEVKLI